MPAFLLDVNEDEDGVFADEVKAKVRSVVPDLTLLDSDNIELLKKWLKEDGGAELIEEAFHDIWRTYELGELLPVVKGLPWNNCLRVEGGKFVAYAVQHLYAGPETVRKHEDSAAWVQALLDTFAPEGQDVCMILHDRDLDGYENRPYYLLSRSETRVYTQRQNVQIIVFTHSDNPVTRCLSVSKDDVDGFLSGISALPEKLASEQNENVIMDNL